MNHAESSMVAVNSPQPMRVPYAVPPTGRNDAGHDQPKEKVLDFFLPMQTRKWLRLLRNDGVSGVRIAPNLDLGRDELGFSFRSNELGLRGPCDTHAGHVIFGSSFAMGFAVDNGHNWHEHAVPAEPRLNLGLPVGVHQLEALLDNVHTGPRDRAVVLYHPNIWTLTKQYDFLAGSGRSAFDFFRWQMDRKICFQMQLKVMKQRAERIKSGSAFSFRHNGMRCYVDSQVCLFDFQKDWNIFVRGIAAWRRMLAGFNDIVFVRIPMKQELCETRRSGPSFHDSRRNYDFGWLMTKEFLAGIPGIRFFTPDHFTLDDYHPLDGHWNASGNKRFAAFLENVLSAAFPGGAAPTVH